MIERVQSVQITDLDLKRHQERQQTERHLQHRGAFLAKAPGAQMICGHSRNDQGSSDEERHRGMGKSIGERWIEDHREPIGGEESTIDNTVTRWRLHPAIHREDPECREQRANGNHHCSKEVHPRRHTRAAEQKHTEECRLEKERREPFVGHQWSDDVGRGIRITAPVAAELERHDDARHDTHAEGNGEDLQPEL